MCLAVLVALLLGTVLPLKAAAQGIPDGTKYVTATLVSDQQAVPFLPHASEPIGRVGVLFAIEPGWHIYWHNSGEAATPTRIEWSLPDSLEVGELAWPVPIRFKERGNITTFGYRDEVLLAAPLRWRNEAETPPTDTLELEASVSWLVCKDICVPGRTKVSLSMPLSLDTESDASKQASLFEKYAQLVPRTLSETERLAETRPQILFASEPGATAPSAAGVFLPNLPVRTVEEAAASLQVFPFRSSAFSTGSPEAAVVPKSDARPAGVLIRFALQPNAGATVIGESLRLVLAAEDRGTEAEVSVVEIEDCVDVTSTKLSDLTEATSSFAPLTFRTATFSDSHPAVDSASESPTRDASTSPTAASNGGGILWALLSAFIGGMLLNLMPCVLPIISIKVMGFLSAADSSPRESRVAALLFSAGILSSFLVLALVVAGLRAAGYQTGWGFQFQHPGFVIALTLVVYLLGLGFFDRYTIALPYLRSANKIVGNLHPSGIKHFFDGVLATALSTPCTAPFLGVALLVAFSQSTGITILIFLAVGLGLALPYAWLTTHPTLLRRLPKPGPWMYRVRQLMGFCLFGTVVWLLFVLHRLTSEGVIWLLLGLLLIYFCLWLREWAKESGSSRATKVISVLSGIAIVGYLWSFYPLMTYRRSAAAPTAAHSAIQWQPYSESTVENLVAAGNSVFIDFTADWCITCKANEFLVIETDEVQTAMKEHGITPVKADWTTGDEAITKALKRYGGEGVPLYVVLSGRPGKEPIVLPTVLTKSRLINALKQASILSTN
ncbi:MAG: thioredoxin family protein [Bdellovibrionales bacterium]|nr:thioredoxin family protein [Bdellovibrionales bacterium]